MRKKYREVVIEVIIAGINHTLSFLVIKEIKLSNKKTNEIKQKKHVWNLKVIWFWYIKYKNINNKPINEFL